ncbi:MAG: protein arginine kinase [Planctomycetota bacterium]
MMLFEPYQTPGAWLAGDGPEADSVISSRIRLARNVKGFPFVGRMRNTTKKEFVEFFLHHVEDVICEYRLDWVDFTTLEEVDLRFLYERHLVSNEIVEGEGPRGILVNREESIAIMVNEEDHLRVQCLASGFAPGKFWQQIDRIDDLFDARIPYAFDPGIGYLTSCPTNAGTGIRVSVMLHLPGLVITNEIRKVFNAVGKLGLTVRGLYGEGTEGLGDFFQVSNQVTLGVSEADIIARVGSIVPRIIGYERKAREVLLKKRRLLIEDRIGRAQGILRHAQAISSEEALTLLSLIRLGVATGLVSGMDLRVLNNLFLNCQPSHLQKRLNRTVEAEERDALRAAYLREHFNKP